MSNPWNTSGIQPDNSPWTKPGDDSQRDTPGGQNPWSNPQETVPPTMGWRPAHPQPPENTADLNPVATSSPRNNRIGGFLIGLISILALTIIGLVAWLFLSGRMGDTPVNSASPDAVPVVTTSESDKAEPAQDSSADNVSPERQVQPDQPTMPPAQSTEVAPAPNSPQASARSVERRTTAQSPAVAIPSAAQQAGLTANGWSDNAATRCGGNQNLIYAGRDNDAWITVCESGGQMTYRSDIFGGTLTATVDPNRSNPAAGQFYINASPSIIEVVGGGVEVYQGGSLVAEKSFPSAWVLY